VCTVVVELYQVLNMYATVVVLMLHLVLNDAVDRKYITDVIMHCLHCSA